MYEALYKETKNRIEAESKADPYSALMIDIYKKGKKDYLADLVEENLIKNGLDRYTSLSVHLYLTLIQEGFVKEVNNFRMRLYVDANANN